jgi:hypothetical protein
MRLSELYMPTDGEHRCFYCGAKCGDEYQADVKDTFTDYGLVACPSSPYRCRGCFEMMGEKSSIMMIDGEVRTGQKCRCYSWIIQTGRRVAATKAHRAQLLEWVMRYVHLEPWGMILSTGGQKQFCYLAQAGGGVICMDGENVVYTPQSLAEMRRRTMLISAVIGRPALDEAPESMALIRLADNYPEVAEFWAKNYTVPLFRLAAWFTSKKEDCIEQLGIYI